MNSTNKDDSSKYYKGIKNTSLIICWHSNS